RCDCTDSAWYEVVTITSRLRGSFAATVAYMLARAITHALVGLEPRRVEVEAHVHKGLPGFTIVGLADRACQEARERVRSGVAAAATRCGIDKLLCAAESCAEAALAGIEPVPVRHLAEAVAYLRGERRPEPCERGNGRVAARAGPDLGDVRGQERARRALELA